MKDTNIHANVTGAYGTPECVVVVVGGGVAGGATAAALGGRGVVVVERDAAVGRRASGRNAGILRTLIDDPAVQALALESAERLRSRAALFAAVRESGGVVLVDPDGDAERAARLDAAAERRRAAGRPVERRDGGPGGRRSYFAKEDGVADVHALVTAYFDAARAGGAEIRTGVEVTELIVEGGRVRGVRTNRGEIRAEVVVNAAGAWAGEVGRAGAGGAIGLRSLRRHLFTANAPAGARPEDPWTWDDSAGWYRRPEAGGILLSGCDETPHPPGDPAVDPAEEERLAEKLLRVAPSLAEVAIRNRWACLRTFAPDRRFVIGWDPVLPGLFWVAGLGGHGMTVSAAAGELAADLIRKGEGAGADLPFSPARFRTA